MKAAQRTTTRRPMRIVQRISALWLRKAALSRRIFQSLQPARPALSQMRVLDPRSFRWIQLRELDCSGELVLAVSTSWQCALVQKDEPADNRDRGQRP